MKAIFTKRAAQFSPLPVSLIASEMAQLVDYKHQQKHQCIILQHQLRVGFLPLNTRSSFTKLHTIVIYGLI